MKSDDMRALLDRSRKHFADVRDLEKQVVDNSTLDEFEKLRNFAVFSPTYNLARFLVHYELFKKVLHLPGMIVEVGVHRGQSLMTWAKLCQILCPNDFTKIIYGFDTFSGFPTLSAEDGPVDEIVEKHAGGYNSGGCSDLLRAMDAVELGRSEIDARVEIITGDIVETVPLFVHDYLNLRVSLLHIDTDLYAPTKVALESFFPHMVKGGIVVFDDLLEDSFIGEGRALDDYFSENNFPKPDLRCFPGYSSSLSYLII